jgi:hypothetical protein
MMSLRLVKGDNEDELLGDPELNHGVGVMLTLLDKWPAGAECLRRFVHCISTGNSGNVQAGLVVHWCGEDCNETVPTEVFAAYCVARAGDVCWTNSRS